MANPVQEEAQSKLNSDDVENDVELTIDGDESTGPQNFDSIKASPKSQAIQLKEMRIEHSTVDSRIADVEKQLSTLKTSFENSSDPNDWADKFGQTVSELQATLQNLIFKKSNLDYRLKSYSEIAENSASIFEAQQVDMASKVTQKIERITISVEISGKKIRRTIKPVQLYSDLVSQVETLFSSRIISLENDDGDTIGSQDELLFAYKDLVVQNQSVLKLFAQLVPVKNKRSISKVVDDDDEKQQTSNSNEEDSSSSSTKMTRKQGRWDSSEVLLFQDGLKLFGEGNWSLIAKHVGTRDRSQVKEFSETHRAKKFKVTPLLHETYAEAIRGIGVAVDGVRDIQQNE